MRLFTPHRRAALKATGLAILGAYVLFVVLYLCKIPMMTYPLLWLAPVVFWVLALILVAWAAVVRWLEFKRMRDAIIPLVSGRVLQDNFIQTLDWILGIQSQTISLLLKRLSCQSYTQGQYTAIVLAFSDALDIPWSRAKRLVDLNCVYVRSNTNLLEYFRPGW